LFYLLEISLVWVFQNAGWCMGKIPPIKGKCKRFLFIDGAFLRNVLDNQERAFRNLDLKAFPKNEENIWHIRKLCG